MYYVLGAVRSIGDTSEKKKSFPLTFCQYGKKSEKLIKKCLKYALSTFFSICGEDQNIFL